jgi:hypothetical protein
MLLKKAGLKKNKHGVMLFVRKHSQLRLLPGNKLFSMEVDKTLRCFWAEQIVAIWKLSTFKSFQTISACLNRISTLAALCACIRGNCPTRTTWKPHQKQIAVQFFLASYVGDPRCYFHARANTQQASSFSHFLLRSNYVLPE